METMIAPSATLDEPDATSANGHGSIADGARISRRSSQAMLVRLLQFIADLVLLNATFHLMLFVRFGAFFPQRTVQLGGAPWAIYPHLEIFLNFFWIFIALSLRVYRPLRTYERNAPEQTLRLDQIRVVARAGIFLAGTLLLFIVAQGGYNFYSRLFIAYFLTSIPIVLVAMRIIAQSAAATVRHQTSPTKSIVVIGAGHVGERFYETVRANSGYGYRVLGFLDDNTSESHVRPMILGTLRDLDRVLRREAVDEVIIALPHAREETIAELVAECENRCIRVALLPGDTLAVGSRSVEQIGEFSLVRMREAPLDEWISRVWKRSFDLIFSGAVLVLVFPIVFLVSALLIKLGSRGPILFKQERTGEDGRTFICYKFRTMHEDADDAPSWQATRNDPRMTSFGRILRRTSMDELPQFWNVLKGEMSVVGPRPHPLKLTEDYRKIIAKYMVRHFVRPGLTGWAQINGYRGETKNPEAMRRRVEHDLYYIENWSFLFDLTIVARTIVCVLRGDKNAY